MQPRESIRGSLGNLLTNSLRATLVVVTTWMWPAPASAVIIEADTTALLARADALKTSEHAQFVKLLESLQARVGHLLPHEQESLKYLQAWQRVYDGDYEDAVRLLDEIVQSSNDATLRFRAGSTLTNALALATRYEAALARLSQLLEQLPTMQAPDAREQLLGVASFLYNQVGQYDLALLYSQQLIDDNWNGRGICKGGQVQLEALFRTGRLTAAAPQYQNVIDACLQIGERVRANLIRTYIAGSLLEQQRGSDALAMLNDSAAQVEATHYPRLQAEFDALLAQAHRQAGNAAQARQFALRAIKHAGSNTFTEPVVAAYRILYQLASEQRDFEAALLFHEKFATADKGYLDDASARRLAYERARNEAVATRAQVDALNRRNQLLLLRQELDSKAVEASRLYSVLLFTVLVFIALWAYRTKRSQLHFKHLARHDAMTGIANRPYFMDRAHSVLAAAQQRGTDVCVVLCDLDHFKSINDRYGHAVGDFVIKQVVAACRRQLRAQDIFGRLGGEEFGIVLPGCNAEQGRAWSEQLRHAITFIPTREARMTSSVSASLGLAATAACGYELRALLSHADAALYNAKRAGRNRTVLFDPVEVDSFAEETSQYWARGFG